ncbi:hypothetical protein MaudCBS49596_003804 [Microsporum audouinii]
MKLTNITAILIGMIAATEATRLQLCKKVGKKDCVPADFPWLVCTNLRSGDGRPFVSGWSEGGSCEIFSEPDCKGIGNSVDGDGWIRFPFPVKSVRC